MARLSITAGVLLATIVATPIQAQSVADFYHGKTITLLIGVGVGGEYDLQARLVARHIGKHIPGSPNIVAQNMTGAGGIKMANYLYNVAPRDGTYLGMISNNFAAVQRVGGKGVQFDVTKFHWLGTVEPVIETMAVWHTTGVKSIDELRRRTTIAGASGRGAMTYFFPAMMNAFLGTKFKIVTGYKGGNGVNLAMQRGEVEARENTWSSWKSTRPLWLKEKKIVIVAQAGPRARDLKVPSVEALAKSAQDRQVIELVTSSTKLGRPIATAPGVPADRVAALRAAYRAMAQDPEFRADAAKLKIPLEPIFGEEMQKTVAQIMSTSQAVADRAKPLMEK